MVEIRNREDLERWLEGKQRLAYVLASRASLRGFPVFGVEIKKIRKHINWKKNIIVPIFINFTTHRQFSNEFFSNIYNKIYDRHLIELIIKIVGKTVSLGMYSGNHLASGIVDLNFDYPVFPLKKDIVRSILNSIDLRSHPISDEYAGLWRAISADATALERGIDLWTQPLWLDDTPEWAIRGWETLATELTKRAPYWKTLVRWYEDRLHGDDWAASQGRPAVPELDIARASLPDSYWKKGGKAVNEAIAKLEDYFWNGVPINDPVLRELVDRGGETPAGESFTAVDEDAAPDSPIEPPPLPPQTHGPHFGLREGLLDFAPPEHLDASKNNIQRLRSLIPLLRAEVAGAIEIFGRNKAHGRIHDALASYSGLLEGEVTALNYDLLAGIGVKLQAEEAAAKEAIADGLEPAFERSETAALKSVLDLHGPVILATEVGQTFVADAERWTRNPRQEKQFRQSATKLAEAIEADGIATPATARFVKDTAADVGLGPQPERSAVFGVGTIRNVSIALIAGAAVYVGANAVMSMDMTHWLYVLLLNEGIKHSDVGKGTSGLISDAINDVTRGKALKKIYKFVLAHETVIRKIAGKRREFSFLNDWLDWLKANPPAE